jgi:hypothetical protein
MKTQGGVGEGEVQFQMFLNSEQDGPLGPPGSRRLRSWMGGLQRGWHIVESTKTFFPAKHNLDLSVDWPVAIVALVGADRPCQLIIHKHYSVHVYNVITCSVSLLEQTAHYSSTQHHQVGLWPL